MMELSEEQLERMKHALGMDNKSNDGYVYHAYRNYSVYNEPHTVWEELCLLDLAERNRYDGDFVYRVSRKGMQEVANATGLIIRYTIEFEPK